MLLRGRPIHVIESGKGAPIPIQTRPRNKRQRRPSISHFNPGNEGGKCLQTQSLTYVNATNSPDQRRDGDLGLKLAGIYLGRLWQIGGRKGFFFPP